MKLKIVIFFVLILCCIGVYNEASAKSTDYSATKYRVEVIYNNNSIGYLSRDSIVEVKSWGETLTEIVYDTETAFVITDSLLRGKDFVNFLNDHPAKTQKQVNVKYNNVRVRQSQSSASKVIAVLGKKSSIEFVTNNDVWSKIIVNGEIGYVNNSSIAVNYTIKVPTYTNKTLLRNRIIEYALANKNNKYVWGGISLQTGSDCSGFVRAVLKNYGVWVPRVSIDQSKWGKEITVNELRKGDLVFYLRDGIIGHVGMYIGDGKIIQALNEDVNTIISDIHFREVIKCMDVIGD